MKFLRKFRSAEEYAEYIRTADSSNMHLMPTISLLAFGDEEKPKVGYVNADLTFKFTTEMEYEERWFSSRGGGGSGPAYSISTFEGVSGQTSGGIVKQAYLDGKLYYVNNGNIYDGGGSPHSLRYNASTSSQASWWDGIIVKEPGQHILQLVLDKTGVEDEFIVGNTGFMNIDELYIDDTITALGEYFIDGNVGTLYVPETVSYIHSNALGVDTLSIQIHENNPYIESISNGNGLVHKDSGTLFYANKNVTEFAIPEGIKGIADNVFYYASDLVSITFPSTLEWIGEFVFYECRGLTGELVIPDSVTSIGSKAFYNCSGLTSVEIGSGVTSIGERAFEYCSGLTSVEIGSGVTSIGERAFRNCSGLKKITCHAVTAPTISYRTFYNVKSNGTLYVPSSSDYSSWLNTNSYYLGYYGWFAYEIGVELPELTLDGYDVAMLVQPSTTGSTKICNKTTDIAEIKVNDTVLDTVSTGYTFSEAGKWNVVRIKYTDGVTSIPSSGFSSCARMFDVKIADSVTSIGEYAFLECYGLTSVVIPDSVTSIGEHAFYQCSGLTSVEIGSGCTSIGGAAFMYCSNLTSLEIGSGVTSIGGSAFLECYGLTSVVIPDSVTSIGQNAFNQCSGLTSVVIGSGATSIDDYAFQNCSNLTSLEIGSGVTSIGNQAFSGCTSLTGELVIPDSVTSIGYNAFTNCSGLTSLEIGSGCSSIGSQAFQYCSGLTSVVIGNGGTSIGSQAFIGCRSLTSLEIGSGVTSIGNNAFSYCTSLTGELVIPDSVTSIDSYAFYYCSGLTSVVIGSGVTSIGYNPFEFCSGLETIVVSSGNTVYDSRGNCNCLIETATNTLITGSNNSFIPDSVTSIGAYAFYYCSGLASVEIGDECTSIGNYAFYGCSGLTGELVIPNSVTSIGNYAFSYCSGLTSLEIGSECTSIGERAFEYCSGLTSVEIGNGCTSIDQYAFSDCSGLTSVEIGSGCTSIGDAAFLNCPDLKEIVCWAKTAPTIQYKTFQNVKTNGTLYVPINSDYSSWMLTSSYYLGYYSWETQPVYIPTECTSLNITADDVKAKATNTTIYWTAVTNGIDKNGNPITSVIMTGETISSEFPQNTSETETVERTITFEYMGVTASTTITQGVWINQNYTVNLNSQWRLSTSITNPDSSTYEGVYESFSNKGVNSSAAIMYIDIVGYETFQLYIRSNGESCCDYVVVSNLDCALSNGTTSGTNVKMTTQSNPQSGTAISNYKLVEFTGIDGGEHRITVMYRKDGSVNNGTDQGYVLIPKNQ